MMGDSYSLPDPARGERVLLSLDFSQWFFLIILGKILFVSLCFSQEFCLMLLRSSSDSHPHIPRLVSAGAFPESCLGAESAV